MTSPIRRLASRICLAALPPDDRDWLRALLAELPAIEKRHRLTWLLGATRLLGGSMLRRLTVDAWIAPFIIVYGFVLARLDLESGPSPEPPEGFFLTRFFDPPGPAGYALWLAVAIGLIALLRPSGAWRWGLLAGLALPLWVYAFSLEGRYFYDRVDSFYPLVAALAASLAGA